MLKASSRNTTLAKRAAQGAGHRDLFNQENVIIRAGAELGLNVSDQIQDSGIKVIIEDHV